MLAAFRLCDFEISRRFSFERASRPFQSHNLTRSGSFGRRIEKLLTFTAHALCKTVRQYGIPGCGRPPLNAAHRMAGGFSRTSLSLSLSLSLSFSLSLPLSPSLSLPLSPSLSPPSCSLSLSLGLGDEGGHAPRLADLGCDRGGQSTGRGL